MSNLNNLVKEIFVNSFPYDLKFKKNTEPNVSPSRSSAITLTGTISNKGKTIEVFIKITPENENTKNKMSMSEVDIYEITNSALKRKLSPHFVHCYNKEFNIKSNVTLKTYYKINSKLYNNFTVLLIEPLKGETLLKVMKNNAFKNDVIFQVVILMQMMQLLYILNFLGIIHYDLHYGNIIIEPVSKLDGMYSYELKDTSGNFFKVFLPNIGYQVKLIDYDGSIKFKRNLKSNFNKSVNNPEILNMYASNTKDNYKYNMYKFLKGHPGGNDYSFLNGNFGVYGKHGHFSSKYIDTISKNKQKLLHLKNNLMSKKLINISKNEFTFQLFDLYHILINKNGKNIILNKDILKSPLQFFTNLENFKLQASPKIIESYSIKPALKNNTVYFTPLSPMNINNNNNSMFINNINIIDPFTLILLTPNNARYIVEEMKNGKITQLYSHEGIKQWMKLYNPTPQNTFRTPQGKILNKKYTRSSLTTDEKKALQKVINKHMLF